MPEDNPYLTSLLGGKAATPSSSLDDDTEARVQKYSELNGVDPDLTRRLIHQESGGKRGAKSWAGAQGLMQLGQATQQRFGVTDPNDPDQNIEAGTKYLRQHLDEFGSPEKALAAYNAGEGAMRKHGYAKVRGFSNFPKGDARRGGYAGSTGEYVEKISNGYTGNGYHSGLSAADNMAGNPYFQSLTGRAAADVQTSGPQTPPPPDIDYELDQTAQVTPVGKSVKLPKSVSEPGVPISTPDASGTAEPMDGARFRIPVKEGMQQIDVLREGLTQKAIGRGLEKKNAAAYANEALGEIVKSGKNPGLQDGENPLDETRLQDLYKHGYADVSIADPAYDTLLDKHLVDQRAVAADKQLK